MPTCHHLYGADNRCIHCGKKKVKDYKYPSITIRLTEEMKNQLHKIVEILKRKVSFGGVKTEINPHQVAKAAFKRGLEILEKELQKGS